MPLTWDEKINKNTAWGGDKSTFGRPVSGRRIEEWIKENIPGVVHENFDLGRFQCFASEEQYQEYLKTGNKKLILMEWNNSLEQGIPIYTKSYADSLVEVDPERYIVIPDDSDIENSTVENKKYDTSINGPLANILFSAIRSLQSEIAKIKNTFDYGLYSYTGTNTAMSKIEYDNNSIEDEPLWAVDEEELSLIKEIILGQFHKFIPSRNVIVQGENSLYCNEYGAVWSDEGEVLNITDPKIFIYLTTSSTNIKINLINETDELKIDLNSLNIPVVESYNILIIISRTQKVLDNYKGNNFVWLSISNRLTDLTILEGYYNLEGLLELIYNLSNRYTLDNIEFKNVLIDKFKIYSKAQDFSRQVIPSKPSEDDYKYKVSHITIRSVKNYSILESILNLLPENELIFVEDTKKLYIKNNYKLTPISGSSNKPSEDEGMTKEEIINLLQNVGINILEDKNQIELSEIVFVHLESGTKFNLEIDSEGNFKTSEIKDETLLNRIKQAIGESATTVGDSTGIRGFVGRLGLNYFNRVINKNSEVANYSLTDDLKLYSDRVKIGSFYAPVLNSDTYGCSHCFIELENTGALDFPLEGCYLYLARKNSDGNPETIKLALTGYIPAGGTYLIRGAKKSEFDDPNTFIKVKTFDLEWYNNGELVDLSHNGIVEEVSSGQYEGNDPHGLALVYGKEDLLYNDSLYVNNSDSNTLAKAPFLYLPYYIDSLYYNSYFGDPYWTNPTEKKNSKYFFHYIDTVNRVFPDCICKNTFELDPAKQAFQALTTWDSSRIRHGNEADYQYLLLDKEYIEFPKTSEKYPVSKFTPKASFEHKNVCTDKTQLDTEKPNMVTCSFGKNPYTTRCFNWISGGLFDEYVFIKQGNNWIKFESYKEGDGEKTQESGALKRKEFSENIINCIYKRMTGRFPAANTLFTSHKCIINVTTKSVNAPTTYTYVVGRADKNGNPDFEHCSEEYTFTLYPDNYTPVIYQTTDQQGFHWIEYLVWAAVAKTLNAQIIEESTNNLIIPVLVNTGDMTQNGTRINEWLDYYNAGKPLFKHLELMNVVGNNDLCGNNFTLLGTGDDEGKANSYYFHVFYCYEVETEDGMIPIINNKYVPSLYNINFKLYKLLAVNSEITKSNCIGWYNKWFFDNIGGNQVKCAINVYTGWEVRESAITPEFHDDFTTIYTMIYNMTSNLSSNQQLIAMCHEMPFTVITEENISKGSGYEKEWRSKSKKSLVGSHLNQLTVSDSIGTHWFSRLLEYRQCRLCIGGHKHTYACTYPVRENYIYNREYNNGYIEVNKTSHDDGPMKMGPTLEFDNYVEWTDTEGKNLSKFPLTKRESPTEPEGNLIFYPSEFDNTLTGGIRYFMCQASGFKLMSNKELPSPKQTFSEFIPQSDIKRDSENNITSSKANTALRSPMYAIIRLNNSSKFDIELIKLNNIQKSPSKIFNQIDYSIDDIQKLYLVPSSASDTWKYGVWQTNKNYLILNI